MDTGIPTLSWQLWRQDDHGHRFLVNEFTSRESAEQRLRELTRCVHKQTYWIYEHTANHQPAVTPPSDR